MSVYIPLQPQCLQSILSLSTRCRLKWLGKSLTITLMEKRAKIASYMKVIYVFLISRLIRKRVGKSKVFLEVSYAIT